jgi:uncharacterized protein YbjT (DUF2867 family)
MEALIIGATGATGKDLVKVLLLDADYTKVVLFVRRSSGMTDPKLSEIITDFDKLEEVSEYIKGDVCFSCLGTTLKAAGSKDKQWHIDYEIPLKFAEIARINGLSSLVLLSAYGASASSRVFYSKIKGKLEEGIDALEFDQYIIFKPGMLLRSNTDRSGERFMGGVLKFFNSLGLIRKFRPLATNLLAEKLARAPKVLANGKHVIELEKIFLF